MTHTTNNFWHTQSILAANQEVVQANTPGDTQPNALKNIPGALNGALPASYTSAARAVYPIYGTADNALVPPYQPTVAPYSDLNLAEFTQWNSAYQVAYLKALKETTGIKIFDLRDSSNNVVSRFVLTRGDTYPLDLMTMTLADYAALSITDKNSLSDLLVNIPIVTTGLGLVKSTSGFVFDLTTEFLNKVPENSLKAPVGGLLTGTEATNLYRNQMRMLINKADEAAENGHYIVKEKYVADLAAILKRYERAKAFSDVQPAGDIELRGEINATPIRTEFIIFTQAQAQPISSDDNKTVDAGYLEFLRAEQVILIQKQRRQAISSDTGLRNPKLDVANLIYQLQMHYEAEAEGIADAGTEEIKQLHQLLQDYGAMQEMLNQTMKLFDQSKPDQTVNFMGVDPFTPDSVFSSDFRGVFYSLKVTGPGLIYENSNIPLLSLFYVNWLNLQKDPIIGPIKNYNNGVVQNSGFFGDDFPKLKEVFQKSGSGPLSQEQMRVFWMFNQDTSITGPDPQPHPIESYLNLGVRPRNAFTSINSLLPLKFSNYNTFLTVLNDRVTLLNQKNQIKQNEIENASRRQNRHFDLGNNALRKMNDMLMTIGRM